MAEIDKEDPLPCPDWIVSILSNVHIARDRRWFRDEYVTEPSHTCSLGQRSEVVGIGTVCLPVKASLTTKGPGSHGILRLCNVLHVPAGAVNIIGNVISDDFYLEVCAPTARVAAKLISRKKGKTAALLNAGPGQASHMYSVKLSGYPVGPRVGPPWVWSHEVMMEEMCSNWPLGEQERYLECEYRKGKVSTSKPDSRSLGGEKSNTSKIDPTRETLVRHRERRQAASLYLAPEELDYVNNIWGDSASFMENLCVNEHMEKDCLRAKHLASNFADLYHEEDEYWEACEDHRKPPVVDRLFTPRQLYYINRDHGNSSIFMAHMDLDVNNEDDCIEAQDLAEDLCFDSDDSDDEDADYLDENGLYEDEMEEYEPGMDGYELADPGIPARRSRDQVLGYLNVGTYEAGPRQLAEHFLSEEELNFVNQTYGDSMSFMTCFNLRFYKEVDCLEAKYIAAAEVRGRNKGEPRNLISLAQSLLVAGRRPLDTMSRPDWYFFKCIRHVLQTLPSHHPLCRHCGVTKVASAHMAASRPNFCVY